MDGPKLRGVSYQSFEDLHLLAQSFDFLLSSFFARDNFDGPHLLGEFVDGLPDFAIGALLERNAYRFRWVVSGDDNPV